MSALAALILAAGACCAAGLLFVPLQRLAEVLSELELRSGAEARDITVAVHGPAQEKAARDVAEDLAWRARGAS